MARSIRNQLSHRSLLRRSFLTVAGTLGLLGLASSSAQAQFGISKERRFDQNTLLGTHNAMANPDEGFESGFSNQSMSVVRQLESGVRSINLDIWLVQQKKVAATWQMRIFNGNESRVTLLGVNWDDVPYEIVVAHDPWESARFFLKPDAKFKSLTAVLTEMREWMDRPGNTREVVALDFEYKVPAYAASLVERAFVDAGLANRRFYMDQPNLGMPPPPARVGKEAEWYVPKHGFPTLNQMADADKRLVLYPDDRFVVYSVYGDDSLDSDTWADARDAPLDDFRYTLFQLTHAPDIGVRVLADDSNNISVLRQHLNDVSRRWLRTPTELSVDFFDHGDGSPSGPRLMATELNFRWAGMLPITGTATPLVSPSSNGWYNRDVTIQFGGIGAPFRTAVMRNFGAQNDVQMGRTGVVNVEGATLVTYDAISNLGNASNRGYLEIRLDKTPPYLKGQRETFPNLSDWYNHDVTVNYTAEDPISGLAYVTPKVVLTQEGFGLRATGTATDRAGNTSVTNDFGINIDKTAPTTNLMASPTATNGWRRGPVRVTMSTVDPAKPGVNRVSGSYIMQYVLGDYRNPDAQILTYWNQYVGGPFEPGTGPFTLQSDGRHLVSYRSVDKALNFEWKTTTINIDATPPHTTERLTPAANSAGWQRGPVTVSLASTDPTSGVDRVHYSIDRGALVPYTRPFAVTGDGVHEVLVQTYDRAGNREVRKFAVRIGTPNLRISQVTNVRRADGKIYADITLYNYGTADAANPVFLRSTLARQFSLGALPTIGMLPVGAARTFTLAYPDMGTPRGTVVPILVQGSFEGGTFSSSVNYSLP